MGTRSEIYIRNEIGCIGLWKHWDGYPDYMFPMFQKFLKYAVREWKRNPFWLTYPEDMAGLLIAWNYMNDKRFLRKISKDSPINADIRPFIDVMGERLINDLEYIYILELPQPITLENYRNVKKLSFTIKCYRIKGLDYDNEREVLRMIKEKGEIDDSMVEEKIVKQFTFNL